MVLLFPLLRASLFGESLQPEQYKSLSAKEWEDLFKESVRQNVAAIAWDGVQRLPKEVQLPVPVKMFWISESEKTIEETLKRKAIAEELLCVFRDKGVNATILKGETVARCYPKPELRYYKDIDIYHGKDWKVANEIVKNDLAVNAGPNTHHHSVYYYKGEKVENHFHLLNHYKYPSNIFFESSLRKLFPSATFDALFLLRHMACHFAVEKISLRHLCDWMMFVQVHQNDVDWNLVQQYVERYRMKSFVVNLHGILENEFHFDISWYPCQGRSDLEKKMINDIFARQSGHQRISDFFKNYWKFRITFNDPVSIALLSRVLSKVTH
ncbi:MAG: nucleotidyltransferase family protein [Bacteroidales bacterium]|nr:nucleotidyltransferase family protein [Candidatus Colimorpha pelethequi]